MKTASSTLIDYLRDNNEFVVCDLYTLSTVTASWNSGLAVGHTDYYYSRSSYDVAYSGHTYSGKGAIIERTKTRLTIGTEVDTLDLTVYADDTMKILGVPFIRAIRAGLLDGALLRLDRAFINIEDYSVIGTVNMFTGRVATTGGSRSSAKLLIKSDLEILNVSFPRNIYQPGCQNALYDGVCGMSRATYSAAGTVSSATPSSITLSGAAASKPDGYFALGVVLITSGPLSGHWRTIKSHVGGVVTITMPLSDLPAAGVSLVAYAGCDRTKAMCHDKFNNLNGYKGCPYVPIPQTAL